MGRDPVKRAASQRRYEEANRERRAAGRSAYKATHRDSVRAADRAYRAAHPERDALWREAHRADVAEARSARHVADREADNARARDWRRRNPDKVTRHRAYKHGLTPADLERLYELQGGKCAICGDPRPLSGRGGLVIDHDHATGARRGLLCQPCNLALPRLEEHGAAWPDAAMRYLVEPPMRTIDRVIQRSYDRREVE